MYKDLSIRFCLQLETYIFMDVPVPPYIYGCPGSSADPRGSLRLNRTGFINVFSGFPMILVSFYTGVSIDTDPDPVLAGFSRLGETQIGCQLIGCLPKVFFQNHNRGVCFALSACAKQIPMLFLRSFQGGKPVQIDDQVSCHIVVQMVDGVQQQRHFGRLI